MIAGVGDHPVDDAKPISVFGGLGHQFGDPEPAFAVLSEIEYRAGMLLVARLGFVIERVHLSRAAAHAQENDPLCTSTDSLLGRERRDGTL